MCICMMEVHISMPVCIWKPEDNPMELFYFFTLFSGIELRLASQMFSSTEPFYPALFIDLPSFLRQNFMQPRLALNLLYSLGKP